jgi:hypothetical protein
MDCSPEVHVSISIGDETLSANASKGIETGREESRRKERQSKYVRCSSFVLSLSLSLSL